MKLKLPNETTSNLEEVSRHYCSGYEIDKELVTTLNFLIQRYIESHPEAFDEKGENQYICVEETSDNGGDAQ